MPGPRLPQPALANPAGLSTAIGFGALYAGVLLASAWLSDVAGDRGLFVAALVAGATDLDAITLSTLRLVDLESVAGPVAVIAIALALISNTTFKLGLLAWTADRGTRNRAGTVLLLMDLATLAGIGWTWWGAAG